ncbi:FUN14 domain-containing protein 1 isoform X1 [Agrilus planipennis]|uniref:FUN14 domain-containing protein 1 isoform X1 n=1 Tax=Agrilus planipennis TaxID=224129 RepID=A0A1W4WZP1_AGRPL|nr:FUN14 domain-containing protein 1 isoform X1 [Agrilus planipennis]
MDKVKRDAKNLTNKALEKAENSGDDVKSFIDRILGDISKTSATKQLVLGTSSGWVTGYLAMKIGKTAALALGGSIILLEIANEKGYIRINWNKVNRELDKVADKIDEQVTGQPPNWMNKMERYVDRKIDKAEDILKKKQKTAKRWYTSIIGEEEWKLKEIHIFCVSFIAGLALGVGTS